MVFFRDKIDREPTGYYLIYTIKEIKDRWRGSGRQPPQGEKKVMILYLFS